MKTETQIIDETLEYIKTNGRGIRKCAGEAAMGMTQSQCIYFDPNTKAMCAIGRCMIDPAKAEEDRIGAIEDYFWVIADEEGVEEHTDVLNEDGSLPQLEERLKPEYRGHSKRFWESLQFWHDTHSNWNDFAGDMSDKGRTEYNDLKTRWAD